MVEKKKTPAPELSRKDSLSPPKTSYHVVGNADQDEIKLSAAVFKNKAARKSLTVHHIQRRLNEWGFSEAYADKDGYYGDLTRGAVAAFQEKLGIEGDGLMDAETFKRLFEEDTNVKVVLS